MAQTKKDGPHPIDVKVGKRLRQGRVIRGLSQQGLGEAAEHRVTFQQIQKYERGFNRIAVSRLWEFARALHLPLAYFFPDEEHTVLPELTEQEIALLEQFRTLSAESQQAILALMPSMRR